MKHVLECVVEYVLFFFFFFLLFCFFVFFFFNFLMIQNKSSATTKKISDEPLPTIENKSQNTSTNSKKSQLSRTKSEPTAGNALSEQNVEFIPWDQLQTQKKIEKRGTILQIRERALIENAQNLNSRINKIKIPDEIFELANKYKILLERAKNLQNLYENKELFATNNNDEKPE